MRETVALTGMILTASPMKEYDRRVEILTRERGRISAFAQGARKVGSALSIDKLSQIRYVCYDET